MMIDLGEVSSLGDQADAPGPGLDRRLLRKIGLAVSAALCLLAVTGSARPEPHGVRPLWGVTVADSDSTTVTHDAVYIHRMTPDGSELTAYDLVSGSLRWTHPVGDRSGFLQEAPAAGLLLMPGETRSVPVDPANELAGSNEFTTSTIAVEENTGTVRWTAPGDVTAIDGGTAMMADYGDQGTVRRIRLIRLTDRSTIWTRDTPEVQSQVVAFTGVRPEKVITASATGEIVVSRFADGTPLAAGHVPWVVPQPEDGIFNDLLPVGDHLLVNRSRKDRIGVTVYRLDNLAELWQQDSAGGYPFGCGTAICIGQGDRIVAHDPATGRVVWQRFGRYGAWPPTEDRVILESGSESGGEGSRLELADASTGRSIGDPARGNTIWNRAPSGEMLLLRPTVSPSGRTSVTRWDLRTGRTHLLGTVPSLTDYRCEAVEHFLTCTRGTRFEVTAVG